jgi:Glycosyltransferase family 87
VLPVAIAALTLVLWFGPGTPNAFDIPFVGSGGTFRLETHAESLLIGSPGYIDPDVYVYFNYAERIGDGDLPYRDFFYEYPPLSVPAVAAPYAFGSEVATYQDAFLVLFGLIAAATAVAVTLTARAAGEDRRTQIAAGGLVAAGPVLLGHTFGSNRLDFLPVLLVALASLGAVRGRETSAGGLAGLGAAAKLWPGMMAVPLAALAHRRGGRPAAIRTLAAFAVGLGVPFAIGLALSPSGLADSLNYHSDRPLHIESLGANLLLGLQELGLTGPYAKVLSYRSLNLTGGGTQAVADLGTLVGLALVAAVLMMGTRRVLAAGDERDAFATAMLTMLAATVALLTFSKVLSPQFMLWLLPFPLLVGGRLRWVAGALVAAVLVLTNLAFSSLSYGFGHEAGASALYLLRSGMLLALLVLLVASLRRRAAPDAGRASPPEGSRTTD